MTNTLRNVAAVIVSNARAALKLGQAEGNAREAVALGLHSFASSFAGTLDNAAKAWGAEQREAIAKKVGNDETLLKSAKDIFKVRLSEAKKMLDALANGHDVAAKYFNYDGEGNHAPVDGTTATDVLNALKSAKVEKDAGETDGETGEEEATTPEQKLAKVRTMLAGLTGYITKNPEIMADALALMLEVTNEIATAGK